MPRKDIIKRIENPTPHYTMDSLKRLAAARNIELRKGINKTELLNKLGERGIVKEHKKVEVAPLAVERQIEDLEKIRTIKKQPPKSKREGLQNYKSYIKNIKKENLSSVRLKEILKTLERKEKEASKERERIMVASESESALNKFAIVSIIYDKDQIYENSLDFLTDASDSIIPILRRNKPTKVKLIFRCKMAKRLELGDFSLEGGSLLIARFAFSSNIETNLESTDEVELYFNMIDLIEQRIQEMEMKDSGWFFL